MAEADGRGNPAAFARQDWPADHGAALNCQPFDFVAMRVIAETSQPTPV